MTLPQPVSVLIVIVNYRTAALTLDCLRTLVDERRRVPGMHVVVTDNASGDGSVERIRSWIDGPELADWITLKPLSRNGGFAFGNNAAIRSALRCEPGSGVNRPPDYVLLLNPDTLVRPGAIATLIDFLESNPDVGIAGSRLEDPDGTPQCSAFRFPSALAELEATVRFGPLSKCLRRFRIAPPIPEQPTPIDWVAGASMLVRREVFDTVGLLDEHYFMYYEEVDFCIRAHRAGWPCWYVPDSHVVHLVGRASGVTNVQVRPKRRPAYWFASRRRYFVKNVGRLGTVACDLAWLVGLGCWQLRCLLQRKRNDNPPHFLIDSFRQSVFCQGFSR